MLSLLCGTGLFLVFGFILKENTDLRNELAAIRAELIDARAEAKKCYDDMNTERRIWRDSCAKIVRDATDAVNEVRDVELKLIEEALEVKDNRRRRR
ncbi:MAG: hypothetical protein JW704_01290 [Anaerolineaceae bacterium]|nr:hypothetical protein [Anaerolineaceae bacterium]